MIKYLSTSNQRKIYYSKMMKVLKLTIIIKVEKVQYTRIIHHRNSARLIITMMMMKRKSLRVMKKMKRIRMNMKMRFKIK